MESKGAKTAFAIAAAVGWVGLFGAGHFYSRYWSRGFLWLVVGLLIYDGFWAVFRGGLLTLPLPILVLWGLAAFSTWLIQAYDAYKVAGGEISIPAQVFAIQVGEVSPLKALPVSVLVLLFLPVALTSLMCATGMCAFYPPFTSFAAYGLANWVGLGLLAAFLRWFRVPFSALGWRWPTLRDLLPALIMALIAIWGIFPLATALNELLGTPMRGMGFQIPTLGALGVTVFYAVVTAPFAEEVLFRGYGLGYLLARGLSPLAAAALMILAFAIIHLPYFGLGGGIFILLWGILPTALRLWRGDLAAAWLMHVLNNAFAYIVVPLFLTK